MGLRALAVSLVVYGSLPLIPFFPFYGLLVYSWIAYMRPHNVAYGMGGEQIGFLVAAAMLIGVTLAVVRGKERLFTIRFPMVLMIALLGWYAVATQYAMSVPIAQRELEVFAKIVLICLLTTGLVRNEERFRWLWIVIAFSLGLLGFKYGLFGLVRGGATIHQGPGGFMSGRNGFAVAINMAIPLLVTVYLAEKSRWLKTSAAVLGLFCVMTVIFTFSRGGFLTLCVVGGLLLLRSGRAITSLLLILVGIGLVVVATPERFQASYRERIGTISTYEEDRSAMGRIYAWQTALIISSYHPWVGVGPRNFQLAYAEYSDIGEVRVAHNAFLQMLAEAGVPAAALWGAIIVLTLWRLDRLRRSASSEAIRGYASSIQIALAGYLVGSMFLDKAVFDLLYQLVAMSVCLEVLSEQQPEAATEPAMEEPEPEWWRRPRAAAALDS